jgi:hypothetical protein
MILLGFQSHSYMVINLPDSYPLVACLCNSFAFLCIVRGAAQPKWITGMKGIDEPFVVWSGSNEYPLVIIGLLATITIQVCIRGRTTGHKRLPFSIGATLATYLQSISICVRVANHCSNYVTFCFYTICNQIQSQ